MVTNFSASRVYVNHDAEDAELAGRSVAGDAAAFEQLVERYHRVLFTVACRMLGDRDEAGDATQNTFIKAHRSLDRFDRSRRFFSWIYRILVNECLNVQRARRSRGLQEPLGKDIPARGGPGDALESAEQRRQIQAALLVLPDEQRQVIVLKHYADLSYGQIAETLSVPVNTVRSRLHEARARLVRLLAGVRR